MSDSTTSAPPASHAPAGHDGAHGAPHGAADDGPGGHGEAAKLGPVDWASWGAGILGIAAAAIVTICLYLASAPR